MNLISSTVLTENLVSDRIGIGESKAELERPVQRDYFNVPGDSTEAYSLIAANPEQLCLGLSGLCIRVCLQKMRSSAGK